MTILTSLLIATQGLLPSPTPLSIGAQGLLQVDSGPPPPPPVVARDLPGGFTSRPIRKVEIRGVSAKITTSGVEVTISASVQAQGNRAAAQAATPSQHISTALQATGNITNLSANRIKPSISTSFEIVGCEEDDEAAIRMLAQAALEEFYLQSIVDSYDD
jgi:hypothetical protein